MQTGSKAVSNTMQVLEVPAELTPVKNRLLIDINKKDSTNNRTMDRSKIILCMEPWGPLIRDGARLIVSNMEVAKIRFKNELA